MSAGSRTALPESAEPQREEGSAPETVMTTTATTTVATTTATAPPDEPIALLSSLPDGVLARIVQATDPDSRRQLRLASRALRLLVDSSTPALTLSSYSLPCLAARGRLPDFATELRTVVLELQDTTQPSAFLAHLPRLGLAQLPHLASVTLALSNDHVMPPSALADIAAALPLSTTRLVLTHMLQGGGGGGAAGAGRPVGQLPPGGGGDDAGRGAAAAAGASSSSTLPPQHPRLDLAAVRHLLLLCPQFREVRLEGGCWVRSGADLRALAALTEASPPEAAAAAAAAVTVSSIRGLYLDAADGYLELPRALAALRGLAALDVQLVATAVRQAPPAAAAADPDGVGVGGLLADVAAALNLAHMGLASEQLQRGLATPALAGLTRLVVREFQGDTMALLGALEGLPLLAHLGLSGLDDAPYITDAHLKALACLPNLTHLAVDRLDISQPPPLLQQQSQQLLFGSATAFPGPGPTGSVGGGGGGGGAILPRLTGLEVALVVHSVPRLPHVFPSVQQLTLRWLWEQAMRKLAGWTSLTTLSLACLACCLDWGLLRTLTGLTQLQLCRGSSYEQLAELLYLLRALPGLEVLRLGGWHCMRHSEPGRMALGLTRGLGAAAGASGGAGGGGGGGEGGAVGGSAGGEADGVGGEGRVGSGPSDAAAGEAAAGNGGWLPRPRGGPSSSSSAAAAAALPYPLRPVYDTPVVASAAAPTGGSAASSSSSSSTAAAAMAAAFAALDPDLHRAWGRIRAAPDATAAAGAALSLLRSLPRLRSLELHDCGHPLLRCLASAALLEDGGPLGGLREMRLSRLVDVMGSDVEEAVGALPGLRRLVVCGCWPVDGEALLRLEGLRRAGVDVVWRR